MKNFKILFIILIVILISLSGCSSNSNVKDLPVNATNNEEVNQEEKNDEENNQEENNNEKDENNEDNEKDKDINYSENNAEDSPNEEETQQIEDDQINSEPIPIAPDENNQNQETNDEDKKANDGIEEIEDASNLLKIDGLVENKLALTLDELKAMEELIFKSDFYSLNSFGTTGYTNFKGVKLWDLLVQKAQISEEATKISVIAQDGYKIEFTIEQVKKQDYIDETNPDTKYPMIIAWEENGEEYSTEEGAPFKLVVGQKETGDVNKPQWVSTVDKIVVE